MYEHVNLLDAHIDMSDLNNSQKMELLGNISELCISYKARIKMTFPQLDILAPKFKAGDIVLPRREEVIDDIHEIMSKPVTMLPIDPIGDALDNEHTAVIIGGIGGEVTEDELNDLYQSDASQADKDVQQEMKERDDYYHTDDKLQIP